MDIRKIINDIYPYLETNNFGVLGQPEIATWGEPLVGICSGDDQYFQDLKTHIGEFHLTPAQAYGFKYGQEEGANLRVVSVIFPQSEVAKEEQKKATRMPGDHWIISRGQWESFVLEFSNKLVCKMEELGYNTVAIDSLDQLHLEQGETVGVSSNWSHRHSAFAAGLGTFGLSEGFITEKGKAVRITTFIVKGDLPVDDRGDRGLYDWCLYYAKGICGSCIRRCPARAIKEAGHDKVKCQEYEDMIEETMWPSHIDRKNYLFGCGICQTKVPCQDKKP